MKKGTYKISKIKLNYCNVNIYDNTKLQKLQEYKNMNFYDQLKLPFGKGGYESPNFIIICGKITW